MVLHGASVGVPAYLDAQRERDRVLEIAYIRYAAEPAAAQPRQIRYPAVRTVPDRAAQAKPTPRAPRTPEPVRDSPKPRIERVTPSPAPARAPRREALRTSAELLADPVRGRVFVAYFSDLKERIQQVVRRKYESSGAAGGRVALYFIVNASGELEAVTVVSAETVAPAELRELAKRCVREAAPFGTFPESLKLERVSFNLAISFEAT
ncbi:MAG: hypothetical protein MOGMAGMI_01350 [Candidatus Omnitrophica bacterium]|nr:hypothetical protein [Candidatus Omnitrophota bacterium]